MNTLVMLVATGILFTSAPVLADGQAITWARITDVREVSRTIIIQEPVTSREEVCEEDQGIGGAILGGVAGGFVGNQFGKGSGKAAMTGLGAVAGALTGQNMTRGTKCYPRDRISYIDREKDVIDGYIVTVDNGEEFHTKTRYHIGDRVRIRSTIE